MLPVVATLLANGLNLLGNAVLAKGKDVIEEKLGVKIDPSNPEELLKLKQLEVDHEEWLIDAGIRKAQQELEETKVFLESDDSARKMQVAALQQSDVFSKQFIYWFAIGWCAFAMVYILGITFGTIPDNSVRFADTILGFVLGTVVSQIIAFFFGSSHRSAAKDATIANLSRSDSK